MVMERDKLVESKAKATGLGDVKVTWVKVAGPSVMNDGVVSGALHFIAVGAPSLITLWDKTRSNVGPWRLSGCLRAHSVLELAAGSIRETQTMPGDRLSLE